MSEEVLADFLAAIEKLSDKIEKMGQNNAAIKIDIDDLTKTKKAKLKTLFDYMKSEFKNYLTDIIGKASKGNGEMGVEDKPLAESGAQRVGGKIINVKIEDINPRIVKLLRDEIIEALGTKKTDEKKDEKKKPAWLLGLLALLAGVLVGLFDFVKDWFRRVKGFLRSLNIFGFFKGITRFFKERFLNAIARMWKAVSESKLGRAISVFFNRIITKIKNTKLFKWIARLVSEDSALGRLLKRIGNFFRAEGAAGRSIRAISNGVKTVGKVFARIGSIFGRVVTIARGVVGKMFSMLAKSPLFKIGRVFGRLLGPVIAIFDIITNVIGSVKQQGLSFKSVLDGLLGGIISFFTLGILNFENIKKITDKITAAFSEGNIVEGVLRILMSIPDLIFQGIGKIATWVAGFFGPEFKAKVEKFFSGSFTDKIFGMWRGVIDFISKPIVKVLNWLKETFDIDIVGWIKGLPGVKGILEWIDKNKPKERPETAPQTKPEEAKSEATQEERKKGFLGNLFGGEEEQPTPESGLPEQPEETMPESTFDTTEVEEAETELEEPALSPDEFKSNMGVLAKILQDQLEVLRETRDALTGMAERPNTGGTAVNSVSNNTIVNNQLATIDMWRKNLIAGA